MIGRKPEQVMGDLHQPGILDGVGERTQPRHDIRYTGLGRKPCTLDRVPRHARGMDQFGVVVVAENIGEGSGRRGVRIDVRVGIDKGRTGQFRFQPCRNLSRHRISSRTECGP